MAEPKGKVERRGGPPWYKTQAVVLSRQRVEAPRYKTWAVVTLRLWVETPRYKTRVVVTSGCKWSGFFFLSLVVVPGAMGATTPYFSLQIALGAEKMNSVCCRSPAALLLSGYVTSGALGFCVLALSGLTFLASMCTSGGSAVWWGCGG